MNDKACCCALDARLLTVPLFADCVMTDFPFGEDTLNRIKELLVVIGDIDLCCVAHTLGKIGAYEVSKVLCKRESLRDLAHTLHHLLGVDEARADDICVCVMPLCKCLTEAVTAVVGNREEESVGRAKPVALASCIRRAHGGKSSGGVRAVKPLSRRQYFTKRELCKSAELVEGKRIHNRQESTDLEIRPLDADNLVIH